jgi:eukaryotic-like serine/threonine-protein kinase
MGKNTSIDARTDVFALGAIVYEMLGGAPAFGGSSLAEVVYKVVHAQPQPLAQLRTGLPLNVLSAVDRALQKDPAHRPVDVSAFVGELTGRPLTVPTASPRAAGFDATLASPAPIPLSQAESDATFTPATPIPAPRMTSAMSTPPARPWATPPPVSPPSAWPAPFANQTALRAELVTAPAAPPLAPRPPKRRRPVARVVILGLALLAVIGVFRSRHHVDPAAALRAAQALSQQAQALGQKQDTVPEPPTPPGVESAEDAKRELKKGLEQVKQSIRDALKDEDDDDEAKAPVEKAKAKGPKEGRGAATPAEASQLLSDAEDALDEEDPKLALRLADQSFFAKKTNAGWAIKARAHCQLKDLGNARAALANVSGRSARAKVVADCKEHGVDLR